MFWNVILAFFAAVGALFLIWLIAGAFLPRCAQCSVAVSCLPGEEWKLLRRYRWLRELGLVRCKLILLDSTLSAEAQDEIMRHYPYVKFSESP